MSCKSHFPLGLQCLVIHNDFPVWVSLQIVSIKCPSLRVFLSFITEAHNRIWTRLFLITVTHGNVNPVRHTGTDRLVPHSHSRLSLHQSLASMSSVSTHWFTWLLIISRVATDKWLLAANDSGQHYSVYMKLILLYQGPFRRAINNSESGTRIGMWFDSVLCSIWIQDWIGLSTRLSLSLFKATQVINNYESLTSLDRLHEVSYLLLR